jgi:gluconolactonase
MNVQVFDHKFHQLIDKDAELERVVTGFEFTEGPIWNPREKSLIFSDILGNAIYHWTEKNGLKKLRRNSYMANGNTYDRQGRVVTCEHATSRITRTDFSGGGELEVLATHYQGKELNSPNDIICKQDGMLYFSDPNMGRGPKAGVPRQQQLTFQGVYRLDPADKSLTLLVDDFIKPNGLCFSNDEKKLFIDDSEHNHIRVFDVKSDGTLHNGRLWAELARAGIGVADGMKMDRAGNIYCTGPGGIHLFDAAANYLGIILMPEQTANLAWGDDDLQSLYITASTSVYRFRTSISSANLGIWIPRN